MKPRLWVVAVRRRLYQRVNPRMSLCGNCRSGRADIRGEHQVTCNGKAGLIMRHDSLRDLLRQELSNAGYRVEIERNAGSCDRSKPGDVKVLNWEEGKDLYIDISIINPKVDEWRRHLADKGVGAAAAVKEQKKINFYADKIDWSRTVFTFYHGSSRRCWRRCTEIYDRS